MKITRHARERSRERIGWNRRASERMTVKVFIEGIRHEETSGPLNEYITKLSVRKGGADNIRIHGEKVFIFDGEILITVLNLPNCFKKACQKLRNRRKREGRPLQREERPIHPDRAESDSPELHDPEEIRQIAYEYEQVDPVCDEPESF